MADDNKAAGAGQQAREAEPSNGTTDGDAKAPNETTGQSSQQTQQEAKKPSKLKSLWQKAGLDVPTIMMMFKGSLPPTIAIAMYQARDVQQVYQTLGYLVAITSVLGMAIMPRGLFIQNM